MGLWLMLMSDAELQRIEMSGWQEKVRFRGSWVVGQIKVRIGIRIPPKLICFPQ